MVDVGTFLRELRTARHLRQRDVADEAGTSQPNVQAYEAGRNSPTIETLERLVAATGHRLLIAAVPASLHSRAERLTFAVHAAVAQKLDEDEDEAAARAAAREFLKGQLASGQRRATRYFEEWRVLVEAPREELLDVFFGLDDHSVALRSTSPFVAALTRGERDAVVAAVQAQR